MKNEGQFSIEFIIVLGVFVTLLATVSIPLYNNSRESVGKMKDMTLSKEAANKLASSINMAYIEGPGSQKHVSYNLPEGLDNVKIGVSEGSENYAELLFCSNLWGEDNIVSVSTLLHKDNHPPIIFENRENIMSPGRHEVRTKFVLSPTIKIIIREV